MFETKHGKKTSLNFIFAASFVCQMLVGVVSITVPIYATLLGATLFLVGIIGSAGGLANVMLGEADVAGVHLKDPETGVYNTPFLAKYWLDDKAVVIKGFKRLWSSPIDTPLGLEG